MDQFWTISDQMVTFHLLKMRFYRQKCQATSNKQSCQPCLWEKKKKKVLHAHTDIDFLRNLICAHMSTSGQKQQSWPDRDGRSAEQAWTVWSQPEMRLPPLQTLLIGHSHAACMSDKLKSYESLEQLTGHMYADVTKVQQHRLEARSAVDGMVGGTLPF